MGRNSVRPWTTPRTMTCRIGIKARVMDGAEGCQVARRAGARTPEGASPWFSRSAGQGKDVTSIIGGFHNCEAASKKGALTQHSSAQSCGGEILSKTYVEKKFISRVGHSCDRLAG